MTTENPLLDQLLNPPGADPDPLKPLRDAFNAALATVIARNNYLGTFECPDCSTVDQDGVRSTPCALPYCEQKMPEWIATRTAEQGKHDCPLNLECWQAANRLLIARDFGDISDDTWLARWSTEGS